jgi:hypothetical protein
MRGPYVPEPELRDCLGADDPALLELEEPDLRVACFVVTLLESHRDSWG